MNTSWLLARRYLLSAKKSTFINVISLISVVVVGVGTAALVVVLSVFNGLEDVIRQMFASFDADLVVKPVQGKTFVVTDSLRAQLEALPQVDHVSEILEDNAFLRYNEAEMVATLKGVPDDYLETSRLPQSVVLGEAKLLNTTDDRAIDYAIVGGGVYYTLGIQKDNDFYALQVYYPRRRGGGNPLAGAGAYLNRSNILVSGVFAIEKSYDEQYVFVPLSFARKVMDYPEGSTSAELNLAAGVAPKKAKDAVSQVMGPDFQVLTSDEQHAGLLKAIRIEKLFVYLTFTFILAIASFNIFFALSMLAIEKERDMAVLYAIGSGREQIRRIFIYEGGMIALGGGLVGMALGYGLVWAQDTFGLVGMGLQYAVVDAYPVEASFTDFVFTALAVMAITLLSSSRPATIASRVDLRRING